jgi:hypothetical protein
VADNWSGASLLPSPFEAVKFQPRKHTYILDKFLALATGRRRSQGLSEVSTCAVSSDSSMFVGFAKASVRFSSTKQKEHPGWTRLLIYPGSLLVGCD